MENRHTVATLILHAQRSPKTAASKLAAAAIGLGLVTAGGAVIPFEAGGMIPMAEVKITTDNSNFHVVSQPATEQKKLLISDLGWSPEQVRAAHERYQPFKDFWDAPGMDVYDAL